MQDVSCAGYIGSWDCQRARCFKHQIHLASLESKRHGSTPTKPGWKFLYQRFTRNCWNHVRYMSSIPGAMCQLAWLHYRGYIKIHEDVQEGIEGFPIALQILSWILLAMNRGGMKMMKAISLYRYIQLFMKQWMLIESQSHQRGSMSCQMWDPWRAGGAKAHVLMAIHNDVVYLYMQLSPNWLCGHVAVSRRCPFLRDGQIAMTPENMMASSPKGTFCGWTWFQYSSGFLKQVMRTIT